MPGTIGRRCATIEVVDCELAREALSARLDGEREPVPSARVDEHLQDCPACRSWFDLVSAHAGQLRELVDSRPIISAVTAVDVTPPPAPRRRHRRGSITPTSRGTWSRWALAAVGVAQVALFLVSGVSRQSGGDLISDSGVWAITAGSTMLGAAGWPAMAGGLAVMLSLHSVILWVCAASGALAGSVSVTVVAANLVQIAGVGLAAVVWRGWSRDQGRPHRDAAADPEIVLPEHASRGRRRGHLWPTDGSAA